MKKIINIIIVLIFINIKYYFFFFFFFFFFNYVSKNKLNLYYIFNYHGTLNKYEKVIVTSILFFIEGQK